MTCLSKYGGVCQNWACTDPILAYHDLFTLHVIVYLWLNCHDKNRITPSISNISFHRELIRTPAREILHKSNFLYLIIPQQKYCISKKMFWLGCLDLGNYQLIQLMMSSVFSEVPLVPHALSTCADSHYMSEREVSYWLYRVLLCNYWEHITGMLDNIIINSIQ